MGEKKIVSILPNYYVHILDLSTNVTSVEVGPQNMMLQDHQVLKAGPHPFVKIPPGHYCTVYDPVDQSKPIVEGKPLELKFGQTEIKLHGEPFPLYPGESLRAGVNPSDPSKGVSKLPVVKAENGLHLRAVMDMEYDGKKRSAGEEWLFRGPLTYIPRPEVEILKHLSPEIIEPGHALRMRAKQELVDSSGVNRYTSEEWLVKEVGAYLPGVFEEVVCVVDAFTLTPETALYIQALETYTDKFGKRRYVGDEWLVTYKDTESYIPEVTEEVVKVVNLTVLDSRQYCVVQDPIGEDRKPRLGCRVMHRGPKVFFLQPGERLEVGIKNALVLLADEAVMITAQEEFDDTLPSGKKVHRNPGDRWMVHGPAEYFPPIEIGNLQRRKATPLDENEGIYVRNIQTGQVRSVMGPQSYLLQANEELYDKEVAPLVEDLLKNGGAIGSAGIRKMAYFEQSRDPCYAGGKKRNLSKVLSYRCPSNCAVQVYNYQEKTARVVFGPDLVVLEPHETFNVLFLSAGKPKKEGALITVCLMLGPDFITDHITVETADHARLKIELSMNNYFKVEKGNLESEAKIFAVPDFVGFASREVASKIRGNVAGVTFEKFHKYSSQIIQKAVFGMDSEGNVRKELVFSANNLVITDIDIQNIEPVDHHMRDSLSKSVQMAIEISTKSIEMAAEHEAKRTEQKARGELERQKLQNEKEAEKARKTLLELQGIAAAVESSGQAKAEAQAQAEKLFIEGESAIEIAQLKADAIRIECDTELNCQTQAQDAEMQFLKEQNDLQIQKARELSQIEVARFSKLVGSIGKTTLKQIANSGPESKAKLLKALGIQTALFTDGHSPVNLYQTPQGYFTQQQ